MILHKKNIIFFIIIALYTDLFEFTPYMLVNISKVVKLLLLIYLIYTCVVGCKRINLGQWEFSKDIILFTIFPFITSISCYIYRGQPIPITIMSTRDVLFWLMYFYLHEYHYSIRRVMKTLINIGLVVTAIYIIQQILYPHLLLFGSQLKSGDEIEIRNGLYRLRLFALIPFVYITFFYCLDKFVKLYTKGKPYKVYGFYILLFFIAIYLTLTRQIWFCILLPAIFYKIIDGRFFNPKKLIYLCGCLLVLYIVYANLDLIVGRDLMQRSSDENSENNIRILASAYYGIEYWKEGGNMILGNGVPSWGNSAYGNEIQQIEEDQQLYRADIGIIGTFSLYGIAYICIIIVFYIHFFKVFKLLPTYLRMLGIASMMNLPLACWVDTYPLVMAIICFLMDQEIAKKKRRDLLINRKKKLFQK